MPTNPHLLALISPLLFEKEAAGEILARLARYGMTPIPGTPKLLLPKLNAQQLGNLESQVQQKLQTGLSDPIRRGLEHIGLDRGIGHVVQRATADVPGTPRLFMKQRSLPERQALGQRVGKGAVTTLSEHPEMLATSLMPIPGIGAAYLGAKSLVHRGLGIKKLAYVEPYQQEEDWTCSAACLKAVMQHWGRDVPESVAIDAVGASKGRGAETTDIIRGAKKLGFHAFERSFDSLEDVKELLDVDVPVICDIQSFNHPGKGHYVVLTGIQGDDVRLMDPNTPGNIRTISHEEMKKRWWDRAMAPPHEKMVRWGVVIYPLQLEPQSDAEIVDERQEFGRNNQDVTGTLYDTHTGTPKYASTVESFLHALAPELKQAVVKGAMIGALMAGLPALTGAMSDTSDIVVDDPMIGQRGLTLMERLNYALHQGVGQAVSGGLGGGLTGTVFHALRGGKLKV